MIINRFVSMVARIISQCSRKDKVAYHNAVRSARNQGILRCRRRSTQGRGARDISGPFLLQREAFCRTLHSTHQKCLSPLQPHFRNPEAPADSFKGRDGVCGVMAASPLTAAGWDHVAEVISFPPFTHSDGRPRALLLGAP